MSRKIWKNTFLSMVGIPMIGITAYLTCIEQPAYESTAMFTIKSSDSSGKESGGMLMGPAAQEITNGYLFKNIVESPAMFQAINRAYPIDATFAQGDSLTAFGGMTSLYQKNDNTAYTYYKRHVYVEVDENSGVATLYVRAYDARTANNIARAVLNDATSILNHQGSQSSKDMAAAVKKSLDEAEATLEKDQNELTKYRAAHGIYDADTYYKSVMEDKVDLSGKKVDADAQYKSITRVTPNNPMANSYKAEADVYGKAANGNGIGGNSGINEMSPYDYLKSRRDMDIKVLQSLKSDIATRNMAGIQAYYVEVESAPSLPGSAKYPTIFIDLVIALCACLFAWFVFG